MPLDRLLVETDAPYLAPGKYRGKRNEPAYVVETAKELAKVKGVSEAEIARATTENFFRLYAKTPRMALAGMSMRFTILGCGSSGGVPRVGNVWGNCDPTNPKNRRRRCALLVERFGKQGRTTVLVDTPPDLREQLLAARVEHIDAVLFTHDHADHTHGIDDLRGMFFITQAPHSHLRRCRHAREPGEPLRLLFRAEAGLDLSADPRDANDIRPPEPIRIDGAGGPIEAVPILQEHGEAPSLGFRFGDLAYSPDIGGHSAKRRWRCCRGSMCGSSTRCGRRRIRATSA